MIAVIYVVIAIAVVVLALGGNMYLDQRFSQAVGDRPFTLNGRRIETDDPFVLRQYKKFYALRVAYFVGLLVLLFVVVSHVG